MPLSCCGRFTVWFSDRGKHVLNQEGQPRIENVSPDAAIPGGDIFIRGSGFQAHNGMRPVVRFGETEGSLLLWSESLLVARVPEGASSSLTVETGGGRSGAFALALGHMLADNLHPVANPAVDPEGNIYVTFSGPRGQKVSVPLYKITPDLAVKPLALQLTNPTGLAFDRSGTLFISCRNDGTIHRLEGALRGDQPRLQKWVEGMGIATGMAFDQESNLYVGDRSGTIFKISSEREILVFATLEPSISAYHLAAGCREPLCIAPSRLAPMFCQSFSEARGSAGARRRRNEVLLSARGSSADWFRAMSSRKRS